MSYTRPLEPFDRATFCPWCGKRDTLTETMGALHAEGGCYNGDEYCWDGPMPAYRCEPDRGGCGNTFVVEPTEDEIHEQCDCPDSDYCDCEYVRPTPPEGVAIVPLSNPQAVHDAIAEALGE